ncbi:MAG: hypothetical protein K9K82_12405 [Desulfobacteraceae bacterium]|nr:hypothetical protein [Desulfobacteraceae bacterium]
MGDSDADYHHPAGPMDDAIEKVAWTLPQGPKHCWRGRISRVEYEFVQG